jgi:hypothetical protein
MRHGPAEPGGERLSSGLSASQRGPTSPRSGPLPPPPLEQLLHLGTRAASPTHLAARPLPRWDHVLPRTDSNNPGGRLRALAREARAAASRAAGLPAPGSRLSPRGGSAAAAASRASPRGSAGRMVAPGGGLAGRSRAQAALEQMDWALGRSADMPVDDRADSPRSPWDAGASYDDFDYDESDY